MTVFDMIENIANAKGKQKEILLKDYSGSEVLKKVFNLAYNPTIQFNVRNFNNGLQTRGLTEIDNMFDVLEELSTRKVTGNAARELVNTTLAMLSEQNSILMQRILLKDLRCGVGMNTIAKVWKDLAFKPPRMGAQSMNEKSLAKIGKAKNLAIELKSDGTYASSVCGSVTTMMTRNGNTLSIPSLQEHLSCGAFDNLALEGELVYSLDKATREEGNGTITKIVKGTASKDEEDGAMYQVWDCIESCCYSPKSKFHKTNKERRQHLESKMDDYAIWCVDNNVAPKITLIPRNENVTIAEAFAIFEQYVRDGYEGAILKDMDAHWTDNGKPACSVKIKRKEPADLLCVGFYEGEGKAAGMLGGLSLQSSCGEVKVNVGSGFTDADRIEIWNNREKFIDMVVEVEYDSLTEDKKTKQKSLFLPIFKGWRYDKNEADSLVDIKNKVRIK